MSVDCRHCGKMLARRAAFIRSPVLRRALCSEPPKLIAAEEMPNALRRRVAALETLHGETEKLEETFAERMAQLEREHAQQSMALHQRRQDIISGASEPSDEEVQASVYFAEFESGTEPSSVVDEDIVGVPAFWPTVLKQASSLKTIPNFEISEGDWAVLDYLVELRTEPWDGEQDFLPEGFSSEGSDPGFSLHFRFAPNPMLETNELVLYCNGDCEVLKTAEPIWAQERHDPTQKFVTKKTKKKGGEATKRVVAKPVESFFRIFSEPDPGADVDERLPWMKNFSALLGQDGADGEGMLQGGDGPAAADGPLPLSMLQGEVALRLREDIIPRASLHYISALQGIEDDGEWGAYEDEDEDWDMPEGRRLK